MKRFLFAVAVVALSACAGSAEDKPAVVTTAPATPAVVGTAAPVVEYAPAQTTRRGLFSRLRNRNTATYSAPVMTAPVPATTTPVPPVAAPMPMPGSKTSARPMNGQVVQATGNLPPGTYTTTDGTVVQIGGTQTMAASTSMSSSQSTRRGLFSRLRGR